MEIEPTDAFLIVDVQNDFCPGGALAIPGGDAVVPVINRLMNRFRYLVFSRDWHPGDHCSFSETPRFVDQSWPAHCVENTPGAEFHGDLMTPLDAVYICKGNDPEQEAYSAFQGTGLKGLLEERGVKRIFIAGLATDYCVRASALEALAGGFESVVIVDGCRGVDDAGAEAALEEIAGAGGVLCTSGDFER